MHRSVVLESRITHWLMGAAFVALSLVANLALAAEISPDGIWSDKAENAIARNAQIRQIVPQRYRSLQLSRNQLELGLSKAPLERDTAVAQSQARLWLPLPDGKFGEFRIVESPVMEAGLAKRFPQLRTWLGQGIDDPTATLRFDLTPKGFHAQVISAHGTVYIDPYQPGDTEHYIAYNKQDHVRGERPRCEVTGEELVDDQPHSHADGAAVELASGDTLRTYRLAMATTGEYTAFHGGTVLDGLSAVLTTLNRVNGVYERDLSVRMVLVANNDLLIYTNSGTDPYTNNNGGTMLGQNQSNINNLIGNANYDIGHVMSTGGGGVAGLGVVCVTNQKARGVTGSGAPIGDAFDVDYVAHEVGHQFRGDHTYNGNGCGGGRSASAAYEPGSGITIQAYAGICGADNTQRNSEDYFHRVSLNQILGFVTSGSGSSCGSTSATGNTVPTVTTIPPTTIPRLTPFELDAIGNDGDGDALTYLWEQFNLGAANSAGTLVDNGGPLFRSFAPSTESSRVFPSLRYILNNTNVAPATAPMPGTISPSFFTAELLPSINRTMQFRVTVRDNRAGGGGTNEASAAVTVTTAAGPFRVSTPNTAVTWTAGASETVNWDVAGSDLAPVSTANVRIRLSLDGGYTWPTTLAESVPNNGSANVTVPADTPSTSRARVRVEAVGNIYFDVSDVNFSITGTNGLPSIVVSALVATQQGSPSASAVVATVSDAEDAAGTLAVSVSGAPQELDVSVDNNAGSVTLTATAACSLVAPTSSFVVYPVLLRAEDSDGNSNTAFVNVTVARNARPTLGTFAPLSVTAGGTAQHAPSALAGDTNNNLVIATVSPDVLPGGGSLSADLDGTVHVITTAGTVPGSYPIEVEISDTCAAGRTRQFTLTVDPVPVPGVSFVESAGTTQAAEGGASDSYTVVLDAEPSADVEISLSHDGLIEVTPTTLLFTAADWDEPQTVTVTAVDDRTVSGLRSSSIAHSADGGDYTGIQIDDVVASVVDNDSATYQFTLAAFGVDETDIGTSIFATMAFNVSGTGAILLGSPVTVPYTILPASTAIGGGVDYTVAFASLEFPVDGSTQSIPVSMADDALVEGDETLVIELGAATGADAALLAMVQPNDPSTFTLTILDDEVASISLVESNGGTAVEEGGAADTYSLVLDAEPASDVQISISPDAQLGVVPNLLTFTTANWDVPQVVTASAIDDGVIEGPHTGTITHGAVGSGYDGVAIPDVVSDITDSDQIADIGVVNQLMPGLVLAGQAVDFEVTIINLSDSIDAPQVAFDFELLPALEGVQWTCLPTIGASCPSDGSGVPSHDISLDSESGVLYTITGTVPVDSVPDTEFVSTASVSLAAPFADPNPVNDSAAASATVTTIGIFTDDFEGNSP